MPFNAGAIEGFRSLPRGQIKRIQAMHIHKIDIRNFRLLRNVDLHLEKRTTVIVGRNNSGKTSLTELFRRLLKENSPTFRLEDFSLSVHEGFWNAFLRKRQGRDEKEVRDALPFIEVKLIVDYGDNVLSFGPLAEFIIDLNEQSYQALIVIRYQLRDGDSDAFFDEIDYDHNAPEGPQKTAFFRVIKERIQPRYVATVIAVDPNDPTNQKVLEFSKLRSLLQSDFINAQRGLDDVTHTDKDVLGKILETLFRTAKSDTGDPKDRAIAKELEKSVESIEESIGVGFNKQLEDLFPAFTLFGYPGLSDPRLLTETTLDVERLLKDHTKVHYAGVNGINLPESYNGLGVRNLIFILLKLLEFFKTFTAIPTTPGIHLVFIEEPEVHLHPQMQEVFVRKLGAIADDFAKRFNAEKPWPVQFVITTHSSHLANKAPFDSMRYFLATSDEHAGNARSTEIKDLRQGLEKTPPVDREFLHKYMTLTRCDLLFADKAILIEGTTERLLLPKMIDKLDAELSKSPPLSSQYVSAVEIGGAYAHVFFDLLNFLKLRTLVITDLDTVNRNDNERACKVSEGTHTSNGCIKTWFGDTDISPDSLIRKPDDEKIRGIRRLVYQIPETTDGPCGRSFEDAFMLANRDMFGLTGASNPGRETSAWDKARGVRGKPDFALEYAIKRTEWAVPRYIGEGLRWLRKEVGGPARVPSPTASDLTPASEAASTQEESHA